MNMEDTFFRYDTYDSFPISRLLNYFPDLSFSDEDHDKSLKCSYNVHTDATFLPVERIKAMDITRDQLDATFWLYLSLEMGHRYLVPTTLMECQQIVALLAYVTLIDIGYADDDPTVDRMLHQFNILNRILRHIKSHATVVHEIYSLAQLMYMGSLSPLRFREEIYHRISRQIPLKVLEHDIIQQYVNHGLPEFDELYERFTRLIFRASEEQNNSKQDENLNILTPIGFAQSLVRSVLSGPIPEPFIPMRSGTSWLWNKERINTWTEIEHSFAQRMTDEPFSPTKRFQSSLEAVERSSSVFEAKSEISANVPVYQIDEGPFNEDESIVLVHSPENHLCTQHGYPLKAMLFDILFQKTEAIRNPQPLQKEEEERLSRALLDDEVYNSWELDNDPLTKEVGNVISAPLGDASPTLRWRNLSYRGMISQLIVSDESITYWPSRESAQQGGDRLMLYFESYRQQFIGRERLVCPCQLFGLKRCPLRDRERILSRLWERTKHLFEDQKAPPCIR